MKVASTYQFKNPQFALVADIARRFNFRMEGDGGATDDKDVTIADLKVKLAAAEKNTAAKSKKAAEDAASDSEKALMERLSKALGVATQLDPEKLLADLTAEKAKTTQAQLELSVYRAAHAAGGNAVALLDSRSFLDSVSSLTPDDSDKIKAAIETAIEENPAFATTTTTTEDGGAKTEPIGTRRPRPDGSQGSSGNGDTGKSTPQADFGEWLGNNLK